MKIEKYKAGGKILYRFRASLGYDSKGNQKRIRRSGFETKKQAELAYLKVFNEHTTSKDTFRGVYNSWIDSYKNTVEDSTYRQTTRIAENHFLKEFSDSQIADITKKDIQAYTNTLIEENKPYRAILAYLKLVFKFALSQEIINKNPCEGIIIPKRAKNYDKINYYTKEELKLFLETVRDQLSHQWYVFFRLLAYTGMRRGEALALTWADLDGEEKTLNINKTTTQGTSGAYIKHTTKTDAGNRIILIDDNTCDLLLSLKNDSDFIFSNSKGSFITQSQVGRQLGKLQGVKKITAHGLRHTHCSMLFSAGVPLPEVQDRLGHKDIQTTLNIYNHIYQEDKSEALNKFLGYIK